MSTIADNLYCLAIALTNCKPKNGFISFIEINMAYYAIKCRWNMTKKKKNNWNDFVGGTRGEIRYMKLMGQLKFK